MASTSTRSPSSAPTSKPQRTDCAKASSDGGALVGVVGDGAKAVVHLGEEDFGADALKFHDATFADLSAVEADVVRADAGGERVEVEEFGVPLVDLKPQLPFAVIPIERKIAGQLAHLLSLIRDCGRGFVFGGLRDRQAKEHEET